MDIIGVKREHYAVVREARMPAILVEGGFMTDPGDARKIYDPEFRQRMARAIANGILAYKKAVEEDNTQAKMPETPPQPWNARTMAAKPNRQITTQHPHDA